jgi:hypothetical protein
VGARWALGPAAVEVAVAPAPVVAAGAAVGVEATQPLGAAVNVGVGSAVAMVVWWARVPVVAGLGILRLTTASTSPGTLKRCVPAALMPALLMPALHVRACMRTRSRAYLHVCVTHLFP